MTENREKIIGLSSELANLLKNSDEYIKYTHAKDNLLRSPEAAEILSNYRMEAAKLHMQELMDKNVDKEINDFDAFYTNLLQDETIADYIRAEVDLGSILHDIQEIFEKNLDIWVGEPVSPDLSGNATILN